MQTGVMGQGGQAPNSAATLETQRNKKTFDHLRVLVALPSKPSTKVSRLVAVELNGGLCRTDEVHVPEEK